MQSGGPSGSYLGNLGINTPTNITIPLARESLPGLASNLTSNAINKFERKISGKAEKGFSCHQIGLCNRECEKKVKGI